MSRFRRATATIAAAIYLMAAMLAPALAAPHKLSFASEGGAHAAAAQPHGQHLHGAHGETAAAHAPDAAPECACPDEDGAVHQHGTCDDACAFVCKTPPGLALPGAAAGRLVLHGPSPELGRVEATGNPHTALRPPTLA